MCSSFREKYVGSMAYWLNSYFHSELTRVLLVFFALNVTGVSISHGQNQKIGICGFNEGRLSFQGTPSEQAACLLRSVKKWGEVDGHPVTLPAELAQILGKPVETDLKIRFRKYLKSNGIKEEDIGGSLESSLSLAGSSAFRAIQARYFVIHDTSSPWLGNANEFPKNDSPILNDFNPYKGKNAVAHAFINRQGKIFVGHDFRVPWRATKLETKILGPLSRGLFLHVELLQPRRRDPSGGPRNDAIAPQPGFTGAQYEKLAILYVAASARGGTWLIPAYHAVIDNQLSDAHDDPQNFELEKWGKALTGLKAQLNDYSAE